MIAFLFLIFIMMPVMEGEVWNYTKDFSVNALQ